jgi:hypothetical protein
MTFLAVQMVSDPKNRRSKGQSLTGINLRRFNHLPWFGLGRIDSMDKDIEWVLLIQNW